MLCNEIIKCNFSFGCWILIVNFANVVKAPFLMLCRQSWSRETLRFGNLFLFTFLTYMYIYCKYTLHYALDFLLAQLVKELSFCHKLWFSNFNIVATQCRRLLIFQTKNAIRSNNVSSKYQSLHHKVAVAKI